MGEACSDCGEGDAVPLSVGSGFYHYYGSLWHHHRRILKYYSSRGGRLMRLFWFDTVVVGLMVFLIVVVLLLHEENVAFIRAAAGFPGDATSTSVASEDKFTGLHGWQVQATLYWIRTLYGLLAFPFVVFKLPLMGGLLTRAKQTGYDQRGRTRLSKVEKHPFSKKLEKAEAGSSVSNNNARLPEPEVDAFGVINLPEDYLSEEEDINLPPLPLAAEPSTPSRKEVHNCM